MSTLLFAILFINRVMALPLQPLQIEKKVLGASEDDGACNKHVHCSEAEFCDLGGKCSKCEKCHYEGSSITGSCPTNCPATCEDEPPTFPKCPLCISQEECTALYNDGFIGEVKHMLPTCNNGSPKCAIEGQCASDSFNYVGALEDFYLGWAQDNQHLFEDITDGNYPMPDLQLLPAGGPAFCTCFHNGINCVSGNECYIPTEKDLADLSKMPFTLHDWCKMGMKCSPDQCAWAEGLDFTSSFVQKVMLSINRAIAVPTLIEKKLLGTSEDDGACTEHVQCSEAEFCDLGGKCSSCEKCHYEGSSITGSCPTNCPATCEDEPPIFPKCPLCVSQEECTSMYEDGFIGEVTHVLPTCNDGSSNCPIEGQCASDSFNYVGALEEFFMGWFQDNQDLFEDVTDGNYPMPDLELIPAGGEGVCTCLDNGVDCVSGNECYIPTERDLADLSEMPFTLHDWCMKGMKCSPDQCAWAKDLPQEFPSFVQKAMLSKMPKFSALLQAH